MQATPAKRRVKNATARLCCCKYARALEMNDSCLGALEEGVVEMEIPPMLSTDFFEEW